MASGNIRITWEEAVKQFEPLVKFAAKQQVENYGSDTAVSAEDLYQEGMMKLYDCWLEWVVGKSKAMDEFGPIFRKSLFRAVRRKRGRALIYVDVSDAADRIVDTGRVPEDSVERLYQEEGVSTLYNSLDSDMARRLLLELIEPSSKTLYEALADRKRKEMLKSQGKRVNIPKDNTVRMKHIIRALHMTSKQYDACIAEIREKARLIIER